MTSVGGQRLLKDNSPIGSGHPEELLEYLTKPLDKLVSEDHILVYPPELKSKRGMEDEHSEKNDDHIIEKKSNGQTECKYWTTNYVGYLSRGEESVSIGSRFDSCNDGLGYLFPYMLAKVLGLNHLSDNMGFGNPRAQYEVILAYLFPDYLRQAARKGLYHEYVRRENNDSHVRGVIDVPRFIKSDIPFVGKVAYITREFSEDNKVTEIIRHTIEYLRSKGMSEVLNIDRDVSDYVSQIVQATPGYRLADREKVIRANAMSPVVHPYYSEYADLQRLCVAILSHQTIQMKDSIGKIHGVLFNSAWLWEEYLNTLIGKEHGEKYFHPRNMEKAGVQHLLIGPDADKNSFFERYPDFVRYDSPQSANNRVIDAKYKYLGPSGKVRYASANTDIKKNNLPPIEEDYKQILIYMIRFDAQKGAFLYPFQEDQNQETKRNSQSTYSIPDGIERGNLGNSAPGSRTITEYGLGIPQSAESYKDFYDGMKKSEQELQQDLESWSSK